MQEKEFENSDMKTKHNLEDVESDVMTEHEDALQVDRVEVLPELTSKTVKTVEKNFVEQIVAEDVEDEDAKSLPGRVQLEEEDKVKEPRTDQLSEPRQTGARLDTISSVREECHWMENRPGSEIHQSGGSLHHQDGEEDPGDH